MALTAFLSVYDPSDLPGGSIDPLGYERGYDWLAEQLLPGMTNVAACPRYFGLICLGAQMVSVDELPSQEQMKRRHEVVLNLERFWALANALLAANNPKRSLSGMRGIRAATKYAEQIRKDASRMIDGRYRLLADQRRYGAVGIYGAVAARCHLFYASGFEPTPQLGELMADGFLEGTRIPQAVMAAAKGESKNVSLSTLNRWLDKAWLWGRASEKEQQAMRGVIEGNATRDAFCELLKKNPDSSDDELVRLSRLEARLEGNTKLNDFRELIKLILAYEMGYRQALLAFERLLFHSKEGGAGGVTLSTLTGDRILQKSRKAISGAAKTFSTALEQISHERLSRATHELDDVRLFLRSLAETQGDDQRFFDALLQRHEQVQRGKFDRGARKTPWLEWRKDRLVRTMSEIGGSRNEVTTVDKINPHPYRTAAADRWNEAAAGLEHPYVLG